MPQDHFKLNCRAALLAAIAAAYPVLGYSAPAAQVDFAVGNVTAVGANGQSRTLGKGAQVEQGDTVNTNGGRAQLRFTDGAYVSLQPESQFRIDQYRYEGKQDGNEKGIFSLLKGGLRTITGLVGRSNKANYQVTTSVATIGIRGTEYTIQYGQSVTGTVGEGQIEVCNGGGCLSVTNGESYYVQGQEFKPILTNKRTDLPPPPPEAPPQDFRQGDTVDPSGTPCALQSCGSILTGKVTPAHVALIAQSFTGAENSGVVSKFNATNTTANLVEGALSDYQRSATNPLLIGLINPAYEGNDGIIAWGTATGLTGAEISPNTYSTIHWAVGTPVLEMNAVAQMTGTYDLLGATVPTSISGFQSGDQNNRLVIATMTVDFRSASLDGTLDMGWNLRGQNITAQMNVSGTGASFSTTMANSNYAIASATGFFAGANAARAGLVYEVAPNSMPGQRFIGSAALTQTSLTPTPLPQ